MKNPHDAVYHGMLQEVLLRGAHKGDRTGTGTHSLFGLQARFDLSQGFPLITTKKVWFTGIVHELLWFISGRTDLKYLTDRGVHFWDEWVKENGDFGPIYGHQWRNWGACHEVPFGGVDQLQHVVDTIRAYPDCRRNLMVAWNPEQTADMALPPCHVLTQFYVNDGKLSCQLYQRSADMFLGVPFNIASYSLLTHMIAFITGLEPGDFVWTGGDCHIYDNHMDQVAEQLSRSSFAAPKLVISRRMRVRGGGLIDEFTADDIDLLGYEHHPALKAPVAV